MQLDPETRALADSAVNALLRHGYTREALLVQHQLCSALIEAHTEQRNETIQRMRGLYVERDHPRAPWWRSFFGGSR